MTPTRVGVAIAAFLLLGRICVASATSPAATSMARLEVRADSDCATREAIVARIAARSPRIQFSDDKPELLVRATITPTRTSGVVGEIVFIRPGGKESSRRLLTPSCAEAADAIALIIAVTLDPTYVADTSAVPVSGPVSSESLGGELRAPAAPIAAPSPPPSSAQSSDSFAEKSSRPIPQTEKPVAFLPVASQAATGPVAMRRRFSVLLAGQAVFGPAPAAMPGVSIYAMAALDRESLWSPAVVFGGTHAWKSGLVETGGTASFTLDAASLDACVLRVRLSVVEVRACASALGGRLSAGGSETDLPATVPRPFFAAGASVMVGAGFGSGFGSSIELSARLATAATLIRDSYEFAPSVFHRAGWLTVASSLGVGVRFR